MAKSSPKVKAKKPKNVLRKPLKANFKALFKATCEEAWTSCTKGACLQSTILYRLYSGCRAKT